MFWWNIKIARDPCVNLYPGSKVYDTPLLMKSNIIELSINICKFSISILRNWVLYVRSLIFFFSLQSYIFLCQIFVEKQKIIHPLQAFVSSA